MSLGKQIIIGVVATVSLIFFGIGSYYASKQLFPDPKNNGTTTITPTSGATSTLPTVNDMKKLEPKNIQVNTDTENVVITYDTAEKVGSLVYVTPNKTEKVAQAMKDYNNGVSIAGKWFSVTVDSEAGTAHKLTLPKTVVPTSGQTYYYIVVSYKKYWLPYGAVTDYQSGVAEPYSIKL